MTQKYRTAASAQPKEPSVVAEPGGSDAADDLEGLLVEVSRLAASRRDLQSLLGDLVTLLQRAVRFDRLRVVLHDPHRGVMRRHTVAAVDPDVSSVLELSPEESPSGIAWQMQQPVIVPNVDRDTRFPYLIALLRAEGTRSFCVFPLTSPLRRLGALGFHSHDEDAFRFANLGFLQQLTDQVALAVDNTLHHEELGRERDRLQLLLEVNNALVSNLEPRTLFSAIASCLRRVVAHDYITLAVHDPEREMFNLWALEFAGKGLIKEGMATPVEPSPAGYAFTGGKPVRFTRADLAQMTGSFAPLLLEEGIQALCCLPLTVHDRRLGTLNVGRLDGRPFTVEEEELLAAVANQVAFSVENSLAFQEIAALKDKLAAEKIYLEEEIRSDYNFEEIVGESPSLKHALREVETVAPTESTVLIRGETGTGKELIARAIHDLSPRRERTLVKINCAAIPTGLLESELFGHERGAFTGAIAQKVGRFELADGGTLFLDEVGDIPLELQPKLLRVLQEHEFERLGATRTKRVDVRVVAATNRSLEEMVAGGTFRSDLYYRLNVFPISLPALRERTDDIPRLVRHLTQKLARRMNKRIDAIPADAIEVLCRYDWPGNVRELENAIERAVILTNGGVLQIPVADFRDRPAAVSSPGGTLEATEREAILSALRDTAWVLGGPHGAAARLGLKRTTLHSRMQKLGISRPTP